MKASILIIDDDPSIVHLLKESLQDAGYITHQGYDGQAAVSVSRSQPIDLILLDVNMPMTNGLLAAEMIRDNEESRHIPIILLTGEVSDRVFPVVESMGRIMHIKKPVDLDELQSLIRQVLAKYPPHS
jgi:CheY-like chemotaxis protein